jgi:hypothetical protein
MYIGEADFDGTSVTAVRPLNFKDVYVSEWRAIDVSSTPTFEQIFNHNLFGLDLEVAIQVSQANDGSQPVELMSLNTALNSLGVTVNNTLVYTPEVFTPNSSGATLTPSSLTGGVTANLTGDIVPDRSAQMKFTKTQIFVKNVGNNKFYRDYGGAQRQSGFMRVIVRKRGT